MFHYVFEAVKAIKKKAGENGILLPHIAHERFPCN